MESAIVLKSFSKDPKSDRETHGPMVASQSGSTEPSNNYFELRATVRMGWESIQCACSQTCEHAAIGDTIVTFQNEKAPYAMQVDVLNALDLRTLHHKIEGRTISSKREFAMMRVTHCIECGHTAILQILEITRVNPRLEASSWLLRRTRAEQPHSPPQEASSYQPQPARWSRSTFKLIADERVATDLGLGLDYEVHAVRFRRVRPIWERCS